MKKIYLDYAATTPVDKDVLKAMAPYFSEKFGNPGSLHSFGQEALKAIDESREKIAKAIGAEFREIIFTGSATEANNLALRGAIKAAKTAEPPYQIIISSIEHESILETCRDLEKDGVEVIYLPVDKSGVVDLEKLKNSLNERTVLVSIMYANNVIGTIQPLFEINKIINDFKKRNSQFLISNFQSNSNYPITNLPIYPLFHTDAVQTFQYFDCNVKNIAVDLMTLSSHKIHGPKGAGLLYARALNPKPHTLNPIITGGGQEFGLRSGTENVPAIVGFAKAVELAIKNRGKETKRISELADYFWKEIKKIEPKVELNGLQKITNYKLPNYPITNLPNILNIYFPSQNAQDLLIKFDLAGIAISSGAACSARAMKPSYVLKAIGLAEQRIKSSLRFSFGKFTTEKEIDEALKIIKKNLFP